MTLHPCDSDSCRTLSPFRGLCAVCWDRGVLTHRPRFAHGTGKVLEPGSATPTGMRAVGLVIVLLAMLALLGLEMNRPKPAVYRAPRQVEPYVAEPARVVVEQPKHVKPHKPRLRH